MINFIPKNNEIIIQVLLNELLFTNLKMEKALKTYYALWVKTEIYTDRFQVNRIIPIAERRM